MLPFANGPLQFMQGCNNNSVLKNKSALSGSLSHILAHFDSVWLTLALSLTLSGAHQLTRSLLGSPRYCCVAKVYPAPHGMYRIALHLMVLLGIAWYCRGLHGFA